MKNRCLIILLLIILLLIILLSSCIFENSFKKNNLLNKKTTNNNTTSSLNIETTSAPTTNSNIKNNKKQQAQIAKAYEDYFFDNSNNIAVKANSFSILKKEVNFKQIIYKTYGKSDKDAKKLAINDLIKREVIYKLALAEKINVTDNELNKYINLQINLAKSTDDSYLNFLNKISINDVYIYEKQNIKKSLYIEKYYQLFEKKCKKENYKKALYNAIEKQKVKENIKILV